MAISLLESCISSNFFWYDSTISVMLFFSFSIFFAFVNNWESSSIFFSCSSFISLFRRFISVSKFSFFCLMDISSPFVLLVVDLGLLERILLFSNSFKVFSKNTIFCSIKTFSFWKLEEICADSNSFSWDDFSASFTFFFISIILLLQFFSVSFNFCFKFFISKFFSSINLFKFSFSLLF